MFTKINKFKKVRIIEHFSSNGKSMPNGHPIQMGGYLKKCKDNLNSFDEFNEQYLITNDGVIDNIDEGIHPEQYGLKDYRGGIIVFSTDVQFVKYSDNKLVNKIKQFITTYKNRFFSNSIINKLIKKHNDNGSEYIGAFSIGNFFKGRYSGDNGKIFNEKSKSIEINGISTDGLIDFAEEMCDMFDQETVLVKDLNNNKIYLVDNETSDRDVEKLNKSSK